LNANLLYLDHKRDEALAAVNAAIAVDPNSATAHLMAGRFYASGDRPDDAIKEYEQVLKLDQRSVEAALALARLNLVKGATDRSLTYVQQVLTAQPNNPEARDLLVRSYVRKGDVSKAREVLASLKKAYPTAPGVYNLEALANLAEKRPDAARAAYLRALELKSDDVEALGGLWRLDIVNGRRQDATARLESALAKAPNNLGLLILAARMQATVGDLAKSEALLLRAIEVDPSSLQAYGFLGQIYAQQKRTNEAKGKFREVLRRNPKSVAASTMLAMLWEQEGNSGEAIKEYQHALSIDPRAGVAANNLAFLYVSSDKQLDEALQLAQTAVQALPDEPAVTDTLGWIYVRKNQASLGIRHLESSVEKNPNEPVFRYHLGIAYMQVGDRDKAKQALTKALSIKSDFEGAAQARKALAEIGA
jgi:tetratricopeptide (TPR) repeat protein